MSDLFLAPKARQQMQIWLGLLLVPSILFVSSAQANKTDATTEPGARSAPSACARLPALIPPPKTARSVADFGATPDDERDDTEAIQRALDALQPNQWLVFPPGRYLHASRLRVTVPGTKLWGKGAHLHATNPRDQAVMLMANDTGIYHFTLTAQTEVRRSTPWEARIAAYVRSDDTALSGIEIRGNRIVAGAELAPPTANSASAAGIFLYRARKFLVAENTIERTLADGIHITAGSADGRVINNRVRETGDDMVGIVSYLGGGGWTKVQAQDAAADLETRVARNLNHDIVVEGNDLAGQYWGRGISVVGGRDITLRGNRIHDTTMAAAIYIAREVHYVSFGARNIAVEHNQIERVQTTAPRYVAAAVPAGRRRTGHGAIEVFAQVFDDEAQIPALAAQLRVEGIRIEGNRIDDTASDGIRIGESVGLPLKVELKASEGGARVRRYSGSEVGGVSLIDNRISKTRGEPIRINTSRAAAAIACRGNTYEGKATMHAACGAPSLPVTGAQLACTR